MKITILGPGAYELALLKMFKNNNCHVTLWTKVENEYDMLNNNRCNTKVFPNYVIPDDVYVTMDINEAIKDSKLIVIAVSIKYINSIIKELAPYYHNQHICIATKGIDNNTMHLPYMLINNILKTNKISVIGGGTFASDMLNDNIMGLTVASKNKETLKIVKKVLESDTLKINLSTDLLGVEIFGATKNIIAIGCGIIEGLNYSESTKSMFITKCFNEIINIIYKLGGNKSTSLTYAGIGDLFLTCTSTKSRNYTYGLLIGKQDKEINNYIDNNTIEGRYTLDVFYKLLKSKKIKSDLIDIIYEIVYNNKEAKSIINYLKK